MGRALKICAYATGIVILAVVITLVVVYFTVLKPKQPNVTAQQMTIDHIDYLPPFNFNFTLGLVLNIYNPNYSSFKYDGSVADIKYRNTTAATAVIGADTIPARGSHDIRTEVVVVMSNLISNPSFDLDFVSGMVNFTSSATVHGKAKVLKLFKIKATTISTCDVTIFVYALNASYICTAKVEY